jgi:peptidyl-prolyl cis-trans isomerase D
MLKQLRSKKIMKRIMKITLILVIPSFIAFYGFSSLTGDSRGGGGWYFIKIKDSPFQILRWSQIGDTGMKEAKQDLFREYQGLLGIQNEQMAEQVDKLISPSAIANQAIHNHVLVNLAKDMGLYSSVSELKAFIERIYPQNPQMALQYMMQMQGYTDENSFIQDQIHRMTLEKVRFLYYSQAKASLYELWQEYLLVEEKVNLAYVPIMSSSFEDKIETPDEELGKYYEANKEDYRIPNQVQYEYIAVNKNTLINDVATTDSEVLAYYMANRETEFKVDKQVMVRQIMRSITPETTEEEKQKIGTLMNDLYTSLTVYQADFADLANRFSDDQMNTSPEFDDAGKPAGVTTKKGGLMGMYWSAQDAERSRYGKTVIEESLNMEAGQISKPIQGERGFHILKIEEVKPERIMEYTEARSQAEFALKRKIGDALFEEKRKSIYDKSPQASTLSGLSKEVGIPLQQTELVDQDTTFFPGIGSVSRFREELIDLEEGNTSELLETPNLLAIMKVLKRVETHIPPLEEVKAKVVQEVKREKALVLAKKEAEAISQKSDSLENMKKTAEEKGYEIKTPEPFTHTTPPEDLTGIKNFPQITIRTKEGQAKIGEVVQRGVKEKAVGYVVWFIVEKIPPERQKFLEEMPRLQREYIQGKQKILINENLADLSKDIPYEVNPRFLGIE